MATIQTNHRGFTLLELVITIMLLGVIGGIGGSVIQVVYDAFATSNATQELDSRGRYAMERMEREMRGGARSTFTASAVSVRFFNQDNVSVRFYRSGTSLFRTVSAVTTQLASGVTSLRLTRTSSPQVNIELIMKVSGGGQTISFQATAWPRNY